MKKTSKMFTVGEVNYQTDCLDLNLERNRERKCLTWIGIAALHEGIPYLTQCYVLQGDKGALEVVDISKC